MSSENQVRVDIVGSASGLKPATQEAKRELDDLKRSAGDTAGGIDAVGVASRALTYTLGATTAAVAAGAAAYIGYNAAQVAVALSIKDMADDTGKLAQRMGMTTERVTELRYMAEMSNVSLGEMTSGVKALANQMQSALAGNAQSIAMFDALGIKLRDTHGRIKSLDQVLYEASDRFQGYADGAAKTALANDLLGKGVGEKLIPLLNGGRDGMREMADEAKRLGLHMDQALIRQSQEVNDNLTRMKFAVEGAKIAFGRDMMPTLVDITYWMTESAKQGKILEGVLLGLGAAVVKAFGGEINPLKIADRDAQAGFTRLAEEAKKLQDLEEKAKNRSKDTNLWNLWANDRAQKELEEQRVKVMELRQELDTILKTRDKLQKQEADAAAAGRPSNKPDAPTPSVSKDKPIDVFGNGSFVTRDKATAQFIRENYEFEHWAWTELNKDREAYAKVSAQVAAAFDKETAKLVEQVGKEREHIELMGLTKEQQAELIASKIELEATTLDEMAAALDVSAMYAGPYQEGVIAATQAVRAQAAAMRELANLKRAGAAKELVIERANEMSRAWQKFADDIERSLTDSLYRSFENGQSFAEAFFNALKNTAKTLVLKFGVQAVVQPAMNTARGWLGIPGQTGGGAGNLVNGYNALSNMSMSPAFDSYYRFATSSFGQSAGLSEALYFDDAGVGSDMLGLTDGFSSTVGEFAGAVDAYGGYVSAAVQLANGNPGQAIFTAAGQYFGGPIGAFIGSMIGGALFGDEPAPPEMGLRGEKPGTDFDAAIKAGKYNYVRTELQDVRVAGQHLGDNPEKIIQKIKEQYLDPLKRMDDTLAGYLSKSQISAVQDALDNWAPGELEGPGGFKKQIAERLGTIVQSLGGYVGEIFDKLDGTLEERYQLTIALLQTQGDAAYESLARELAAQTGATASSTAQLLTSLKTVNGVLGALGLQMYDIDAAGAAAASGLADVFGGMDKLVSATAAYYDAFYSEGEKAANKMKTVTGKLAALGLIMPTDADGYRSMVDYAISRGPAGQEIAAALIALGPEVKDALDANATSVVNAENDLISTYRTHESTLKATQDRFEGFARSLSSFRQGLLIGQYSPLDPLAKLNEAQSQYQNLLTRSKLGDLAAFEDYQGSAEALIQIAQDYYGANSADFAELFNKVQSDSQDLEDVASRQANIAASQLEEMKTQVGLLTSIDSHILSLEEAMANFAAAQGALGGGSGNATALDTLTGIINTTETQIAADKLAEEAAAAYSANVAAATAVVDALKGISAKDLKSFSGDNMIALASFAAANDSKIGKVSEKELEAAILDRTGVDVSALGAGKLKTMAQAMGLSTATIKGYADGGYPEIGKMSMVNDGGGPELIYPTASVRVLSNSDSRAAVIEGGEVTRLLRDVVSVLNDVKGELQADKAQRGAGSVGIMGKLDTVSDGVDRMARALKRAA